MAVRAVIFDIGGVLFQTVDSTFQRQWESRLNLAEGQLAQVVFDNPVSQRATVGEATEAEVWVEVERRLGLSSEDTAALQVDMWRGGAWDQELLKFIRSLRPAYRTAVISDAWPDAREAIKAYVNADLFDVIVFSAEVRIRKPNPGIFWLALSQLKVAPQEAVFVDDHLKNVEGARSLGMLGVRFTSSVAVRSEIQRILSES